ncbi:MAG TPA: pyridoxal-dependent decarboxylase [Terriglobales bacterium]|nr:pyridoxal-dependent decarboxylase [Terriglobales bacterium]
MDPDLDDLVRHLLELPETIGALEVTGAPEPSAVREHLRARYDFSRPVPLADAAADVAAMLRRWNCHVTHPRYFGNFNPSVDVSGIVAETMAAAFNPQLAVWSHAPAAVEIEQHALAFLMRRLGFDPALGTAHFTSGGSEANHTAVLAALTARHPEYGERGLAGLGTRPTLYLSIEGHESFEKIAHATGIGRDAVRRVPTDAGGRLALPALEAAVARDRADGREPCLVVATAGSTAIGAVDPLPELVRFCARERLWLHVDAAWGGSCSLSPRLRPIVAGIERADSVTWDAHKWLSVPMGAGMFFAARRAPVAEAFRTTTGYMPASPEGALDPYVASLQWSRRFIGLKVFLLLAELGEDGLARRIERQSAIGDELRAKLVSRGWRIRNDTPLPLVCFSRPGWEGRPERVAAAAARVVASGRAWISAILRPDGERWLRACITSFRTTSADLDVLVEELDREGN